MRCACNLVFSSVHSSLICGVFLFTMRFNLVLFSVCSVMGFGADLQGKESHEALVRIQDAEIRLLENIKRCMQMRVDADKKYATALTQLVTQAQKVNADPANEFAPLCSIFKVKQEILSEL